MVYIIMYQVYCIIFNNKKCLHFFLLARSHRSSYVAAKKNKPSKVNINRCKKNNLFIYNLIFITLSLIIIFNNIIGV